MFRISTFLRSHNHHYSTVHGTSGSGERIVDYLINALRFSKQDAIFLSRGKLANLRSTVNSDSILTTFQNYGLTLTQIKQIVSSVPRILNCNAHKTLEPKLRVFHELGLSGSDLVTLIKRNPEVFQIGLQTRIIPSINILKKYLDTDENVVTFINRSRWLYFTNQLMKSLSTNVSLLQNLGLSSERIVNFMLRYPECFTVNPKLFENRVNYVEEKLGISRGLRSFIHLVSVALYVTDAEVEKKMNIFRSFGWCDSDIGLLIRTQPYCLNKSEDNIREKLEFLMTGLGYKPNYLIRCSPFFTLSLNKRVIPRNNMLNILKDKNLMKNTSALITVASYSELRFHKFLRRFEGDAPGLCEMYMDSVTRAS